VDKRTLQQKKKQTVFFFLRYFPFEWRTETEIIQTLYKKIIFSPFKLTCSPHCNTQKVMKAEEQERMNKVIRSFVFVPIFPLRLRLQIKLCTAAYFKPYFHQKINTSQLFTQL
jgi:hypothetical protein